MTDLGTKCLRERCCFWVGVEAAFPGARVGPSPDGDAVGFGPTGSGE